MSGRAFAYGLWCIAIALAYLGSTFFAYSPFADGRRVSSPSGIYGPTHK
jgi:cbb3-type cytochrome oxidase subunit 3